MKKILILGTKGMAGHVIFNKFSADKSFDVYGIARKVIETEKIFNLDVTDTQAVKNIINDDFDAVINCIGILNKDAEDNPSKAIWFNSYFPHFLEEVTKSTKTKIVHISTDCVFSGKKGNYTENDLKDGSGFYAQSKALGEIDNDKDLTIRTSIIGPELNDKGIGLFHWFMSRPYDSTLHGFSKAYWSGITTLELANVIEKALSQKVSNILTVSASPKIDKYSLLQLFNDVFRQNEVEIIKDEKYIVDKSMRSIRSDFNYSVPSYRVMLNEMKSYIENNASSYKYFKG